MDVKLRSIVLATLMLALVAGCNGGGDSSGGTIAPAGGELSAAQMADVALESDAMTESVLGAELDSMGVSASTTGDPATIVTDITFSRTRPCPLGGEFSVSGQIHRTFEPATRLMEATSTGTRARTDCAFMRDEFTITVNGSADWDAFRRRIDGVPDGPQTTSYSGFFEAVRSDGETRSCRFDVTIVRDPDAHTRTLEGVICGDSVSRTVTWSLSD